MKHTFSTWAVAGITALGFGAALAAEARAADLTVVTWGGAQETGYKKAYGDTYEKLSGNKITWTTWNGTIAFIRAQVEAKAVTNHIYPLNPWDTVAGCDEGLLEKIDPKEMGITDPSDFLEGAIEPCGIGVDVWSYLLAWNLEKNPKWVGAAAPKDVKDMFNLKDFPGRRGIRKRAYGAMENALMGDGVAAKDVYKALKTPDGIKRAFAKLDVIKKQTLFFDNVPQMPQALADGEVDYTIIVNSRFYNATKTEGKKFATNWKDQVYSYNMLSIPKNNPRLKEAKEYLKNAIKPENLAESANAVAYPPSRKSAMKHVKADVRDHLITSHLEGNNPLYMDALFWAENLDAQAKVFQTWLSQ